MLYRKYIFQNFFPIKAVYGFNKEYKEPVNNLTISRNAILILIF